MKIYITKRWRITLGGYCSQNGFLGNVAHFSITLEDACKKQRQLDIWEAARVVVDERAKPLFAAVESLPSFRDKFVMVKNAQKADPELRRSQVFKDWLLRYSDEILSMWWLPETSYDETMDNLKESSA